MARRPAARPAGAAGPFAAEPLERRLMMALARAAGGSGLSATLSTNPTLRQQQLICDPPEPAAGSISILYDASRVAFVGRTNGPGYFTGFHILDSNGQLRDEGSWYKSGGGEAGYVQVFFFLQGTAGQMSPPQGFAVNDEAGVEGVDTHAVLFRLHANTPIDADIRYTVFAAAANTHGANEADYLVVNDGTGRRLGPADLAPAAVSTRPADGSIAGRTFEDLNRDGRFDAGDRPIAGVTVFLDADQDAALDAGETVTVGNEEGVYWFDDLPPGNHVVRRLTPDGLVPTVPISGAYTVSVAPGARTRGRDFAHVRPASVSGFVFNDADGDGVRDAGETGRVGGVTVFLDINGDRQPGPGEPSAVSRDGDGQWTIDGVRPTAYVVRQLPPTDHRPTAPAGGTHSVNLDPGQALAGLEFGVVAPGPRVTGVYFRGQWAAPFLQFLDADLGDRLFGFRIDPAQQGRPLPWTTVDRITVELDRTAAVAANDLRLDSGAARVYRFDGFSHLRERPWVAWDVASGFENDRLLMTLVSGAGGVVSYAGAPLDGEWASAGDTYPSGDGTPGGNFLFRFNVLGGDVTGDGVVNAVDVAGVKQRLTRRPGDGVVDPRRRYSIFADVNTDAVINALDVAAVKARLTRRLPGAQPAGVQPAAAASSEPSATAVPARPPPAAALEVESVRRDVLAHRVRREVTD